MALRMTEEEYREFVRRNRGNGQKATVMIADEITAHKTPKRQKYGNRKVEIDGMKFDSQHEADYYFGVLVPRVKSGELKTVCRQVAFDLPGGIKYIADFVTILPDQRIENVIDAKSAATRKDRVYINKKKQMKACLDIEIQEV